MRHEMTWLVYPRSSLRRRGQAPQGSLTMRRFVQRRRLKGVPSWQCPACMDCRNCKQAFADDLAIRYRLCECCNKYTGLCAAGREPEFRDPDIAAERSDWWYYCVNWGVVLRTFTIAGKQVRRLFCEVHSKQVDDGKVPWLAERPTLNKVAGQVPFIPALPGYAESN